jgi:2-dehydro-3-deoxygluconokinase
MAKEIFNNKDSSKASPNGGGLEGAVLCFGEILLRMSPVLNRQWIHNASIPVYVGGAELNVANALARWNVPIKYCTAMPDHYLSHEMMDELQSKNIDVTAIHLSGNRIGVYYLPQGADLKNAGVIYDRAYSSFAELKPGMIDWDKALQGCSWFHFSAISPALNENAAAVCKEALEEASAKGLMISVDLNYRAKLWQYGKNPATIMPELVQYCHVIMGNMWAVESLLGIPSPLESSVGRTDEELIEATGKSMLQLHKQYSNATSFAYTFRLEKEYWAVLQHGKDMAVSKKFLIGDIVDKVGSGDCFMAGLIYGLFHQHASQEIINYAAAAAFGKLHELGDATRQSEQDVKKILMSM